jgi:Co/Zn/Cd efflux system component
LLEYERVALAMIALITGMTGFVESMIAVPAASTALAADALSFVLHSASAGFALRTLSGLSRPRWTVPAQGALMSILGLLVCLIAIRRFLQGSIPHPFAMIVMGFIALIADLVTCAVLLHARGQLTGLMALWRFGRSDAVGNIAVIAAAITVIATGSNIPDLVIGGAMAGLFVMSGFKILQTGHTDTNRLR